MRNLLPQLAWRNLWRNPRRTWITLLGAAFAAMVLVFMASFQQGGYSALEESATALFHGHVQLQAPGYQKKEQIHRSLKNVDLLMSQLPESVAASPRAMAFALVSSAQRAYGVRIAGVDPGREARVSSIPTRIRQGHFLAGRDTAEAIIGAALARNLRVRVGDELTLLSSGHDGSSASAVVKLVGIFETGVDEMDRGLMEVPLAFFQETFSMPDGAHAIVVRASSIAAAERLAGDLRARFSSAAVQVYHWKEILPGVEQLIHLDMAATFPLYIALVLIVSFGLLNTLLMSVLERTREFGTFMALGMAPRRVGQLMMMESLFLVSAGLVLGIGMGSALCTYFSSVGITVPGGEEIARQFNVPKIIRPVLSGSSLFLGPGLILAAAVTAAGYIAARVRRLEPLKAMRIPA